MRYTDKENISGADALLASLINQGVETVFGYPGGSITPVYDRLQDYPELHHLLTRHEQGAVHAAQGYARVSNQTGVCMATSGPGATNLLTGIADAMLDSTPVVCIAAQVPAAALGTDFFQEADMINMTIPITKWNYQITRFDEIVPTIAKAFYVARAGRPGPVYIEITKNALVERGDYHWKPCTGIRSYNAVPSVEPQAAADAVEMINAAERPLIIVGNGVKISGAEAEVLQLAEAGNIPIASTLMGLSSIPSDHPLYIGMVGMHGNVAGNRMTQEADLLIAVGMRFSDRVTGDLKSYAPKARVIHIEIDPVEINKNVRTDLPIVADAREAVQAILSAGTITRKPRPEWLAEAARYAKIELDKVINRQLHPNREELTMGETVATVAALSKGEAVIVTDVGQHQMMAARYSTYKHSRSLITSGGLGTMGYGLPAAIGAKVALNECPSTADRDVVVFLGDGGFQMTMQELGTMIHWGISVKVVVLNNSFLGMVRQWQQLFMEKRYNATELVNPDFVKIAEAYDIPARRVTRRFELQEAVQTMLDHKGPYFLEVIVGREDNVFPMVPGGASLDDLLYSE
ncbi:MAG TPA: biosynthetic-type acetolactate synthase large subunit [Candidatus Rikenella faecigallinarum]|uniref:Acetolactate synthase n=1 Tax=Candidatus Rikenella faecigallinarum TaxID=2838745 RepID=A0A9D1QCM7_9BACT|nr:biosynthetic-type acetolactate synthase large subunit [Candidatus Rikenella faecigallinarum]